MEEERDADFAQDHMDLQTRLLGANSLQPRGIPFHFEGVFGCARTAYAYNDPFPFWSNSKISSTHPSTSITPGTHFPRLLLDSEPQRFHVQPPLSSFSPSIGITVRTPLGQIADRQLGAFPTRSNIPSRPVSVACIPRFSPKSTILTLSLRDPADDRDMPPNGNSFVSPLPARRTQGPHPR
ncbi:hypothetical protein H4582DRAFT_2092194 [Lactarius indigo]|nr:hypothetical protein H4582DRAFT_2092194 [Lactarius indigo]